MRFATKLSKWLFFIDIVVIAALIIQAIATRHIDSRNLVGAAFLYMWAQKIYLTGKRLPLDDSTKLDIKREEDQPVEDEKPV